MTLFPALARFEIALLWFFHIPCELCQKDVRCSNSACQLLIEQSHLQTNHRSIVHMLVFLSGSQGSTCKKEWDKFDRQIKAGGLPGALAPFLKKKKQDIFALWLDNKEDWDRVSFEVQRWQEQRNLSRKEWTAVQYKELEKTMDSEKLDKIVKKRQEQGLTYPDEDFPEDPKDRCGEGGWPSNTFKSYHQYGNMVCLFHMGIYHIFSVWHVSCQGWGGLETCCNLLQY